MLEVLDSTFGILTLLMIPSFAIGVIGVFFAIYARSEIKKTKRKPWKIAKLLLVQLVVLFALTYGISAIINLESRNSLKDLLNQESLKIKIDGQNTDEEYFTQIIIELNKIKSYSGPHSHPEKEFLLEISSQNQKMELTLKQDSDTKNEYCVFWNKYDTTSLHEIGRVTTDIFEK